MSIFDEITNNNYYHRVCLKFTRDENDAYDLMMNTALVIKEKNYKLTHPKTLFYQVARSLFLKEKKKQIKGVDDEVVIIDNGKSYEEDLIDCVLNYSENKVLSKRDFVTIEIFKLYLKHGTHQAVSDVTGINRKTITAQIKRFKKNAVEYCSRYNK